MEERHLRHLLTLKQQTEDAGRTFETQIEDFVLELNDDGASYRGIGEIAGVSHGTVRTWVHQAKARQQK